MKISNKNICSLLVYVPQLSWSFSKFMFLFIKIRIPTIRKANSIDSFTLVKGHLIKFMKKYFLNYPVNFVNIMSVSYVIYFSILVMSLIIVNISWWCLVRAICHVFDSWQNCVVISYMILTFYVFLSVCCNNISSQQLSIW